jgi:UDP-N-acetylglucosamine--N-acetylmuramyl-(pentapeptide) pyrophosphoryl-undecaprenol N-acetylglucosamine transferase
MSDKATSLNIVLSGGDTGGHLYLAVALIDYMRRHAPAHCIAFAGAPGRLPMGDALPPDMRTYSLNILPYNRKSALRNLQVYFSIARGIRQSLRILSTSRPDAVVGLGGYPSGPFLYAATLKKIPTLIMEPNALPGLANRLLAKRVDRICVAFDETAACFSRDKVVVTGTPVRKLFTCSLPDKTLARRQLGLNPDMRTCLVIGGSLGSGKLNDALLQSMGTLSAHNIQILWQTGREQFADISAVLESGKPSTFTILPFIKDMALAYAAADLAVSAGGAITIAELAVASKPAIIIPSAGVTENHQYYNARALAREEACVMIEEKDSAKELPGAIIDVLGSAERLHRMQAGIRQFARPQAAECVVDELLKLCPKGAAAAV